MKRKMLLVSRTLNPDPDAVKSDLFKMEFFDPHDRAQVKYEMLRAHEVEAEPVAEACRWFGFSRESFYQIQKAFREQGFRALLPAKRGRKGPIKLKGEILQFARQKRKQNPDLGPGRLAALIGERYGVALHRTTVLRGMKKKNGNRRRNGRPEGGVADDDPVQAIYESARREALQSMAPASVALERVRQYGVAALWAGSSGDLPFILYVQSVPRPAWSGARDFHREALGQVYQFLTQEVSEHASRDLCPGIERPTGEGTYDRVAARGFAELCRAEHNGDPGGIYRRGV